MINKSSFFGYTIAKWNKAKEEMRDFLVRDARTGVTPTYAFVADSMSEITFTEDSPAFRKMLSEIAEEEEYEARGMLTVLVVNKETGKPDQDFFDLAATLDKNVDPLDQESKNRFWMTEIALVRSVWKQKMKRKGNFY